MAVFDPAQMVVLLNGREINDWADGADVIDAKNNKDAGEMIMGANGTGVFVKSTDKSGLLTLKIKQHSPDNKYLTTQLGLQDNSIKTFVPFTLQIRDLLNDDVVNGAKGYFTTRADFKRGQGHNPESWVLVFERLDIKLEKGLGN